MSGRRIDSLPNLRITTDGKPERTHHTLNYSPAESDQDASVADRSRWHHWAMRVEVEVDGISGQSFDWSKGFHLYLRGARGLAVAETFRHNSSAFVAGYQVDSAGDDANAMAIREGLNRIGAVEVDGNSTGKSGLVRLAAGWRFMLPSFGDPLFVLHDSVLPELRGWNSSVTALKYPGQVPGLTVFLADEGMDTGPVLVSARTPVASFTSIQDLLDVQARQIPTLIQELIRQLTRGRLTLKAQDEQRATYSVWRDGEDYRIDWRSHAADVLRHIRACGPPYEGATTLMGSELLRVVDAQLLDYDLRIINRDAGKVMEVRNDGIVVVCGQGLLLLTRLESLGGRPYVLRKVRARFA